MARTGHLLRSLAFAAVFGLSAGPVLTGPAFATPTLELPAAPARPDVRLLAAESERDLLAGKAAELKRPMTAGRAALIFKEPDVGTFRRELGYMAAPKLRELARLEPRVPERFASVLAEEQAAWLRDVNQALETSGVRADGPVKSWYSMLGKLDRYTETNLTRGRLLADGSPVPATPADLNDLTRARVNLPRLAPALLHRLVATVQAALPEKRPLCALNFVVKDYASEAVLEDPTVAYKGRVHLIIEDVTGGIKRGAFELQLGPRHLTEYWDRHFKVAGTNQDFDLHDSVYKGVAALSRPEHLERLGRGMHPGVAMTPAEAVSAGRRVVDGVVAEYQRQLAAAVDQARRGTPSLDYDATEPLRTMIGRVFHALQGAPDLPEGLQAHQHAPL